MDANHAVVIFHIVTQFCKSQNYEAEIKYIHSFEDKSILDNKIVLIESADPDMTGFLLRNLRVY